MCQRIQIGNSVICIIALYKWKFLLLRSCWKKWWKTVAMLLNLCKIRTLWFLKKISMCRVKIFMKFTVRWYSKNCLKSFNRNIFTKCMSDYYFLFWCPFVYRFLVVITPNSNTKIYKFIKKFALSGIIPYSANNYYSCNVK